MMVPASVGGYRIIKEIARGAFSRVFMVQHPTEKKRYALKLLEDAQDVVRVSGLKREFRLLKEFEHPNLPAVSKLDQHVDDRLYTVMQLLPGANLRVLLRHHRGWVLKALPYVLKTVGAALQYIHARGVVHCDVKPENVVVGPGGRSSLVDFASARTRWDRWRFWEKIPKEASPSYIAPEQVAGKRPVPATDTYAMGIMVFEILAGRAPFTGTSVKALYEAHLRKEAPPLDKFLPGVDAGLSRSLAQALHKKPEYRSRDVSAWVYRLAALIQEHLQKSHGAADGARARQV